MIKAQVSETMGIREETPLTRTRTEVFPKALLEEAKKAAENVMREGGSKQEVYEAFDQVLYK